MVPRCCLVNLTDLQSHWILELILQKENINKDENCFQFQVETKYFNAEISLHQLLYSDISKEDHTEQLEKTEALLLYCEGTKDSFVKADQVWSKVKEFSPAVCLCIVDSTKDKTEGDGELSRTEILSWCLANQFELVECDEEQDEVGELEDKVGKDRILEAIKSHTWSSMKLLNEPSEEKGKDYLTRYNCVRKDIFFYLSIIHFEILFLTFSDNSANKNLKGKGIIPCNQFISNTIPTSFVKILISRKPLVKKKTLRQIMMNICKRTELNYIWNRFIKHFIQLVITSDFN